MLFKYGVNLFISFKIMDQNVILSRWSYFPDLEMDNLDSVAILSCGPG